MLLSRKKKRLFLETNSFLLYLFSMQKVVNLPEGCVFHSAHFNKDYDCWEIILSNDDWEEVRHCEEIPIFEKDSECLGIINNDIVVIKEFADGRSELERLKKEEDFLC